MESKCVALAKEIICAYLGTNITPEGCSAIYNIRSGDTEELICHIKAMISIFESAKIDLEQGGDNNG
jgi:hypothetical protein